MILLNIPCRRAATAACGRLTGRFPFFLFASVLALNGHAAPVPQASDSVELGRRIYQEGILPSGAALKGERFDKIQVQGGQAACIACHRHSGMGAVEGDTLVSPITGSYLFNADSMNVATMDPRIGKRFNEKHAPYTDKTLTETLRTGVNNNGRKMSVIMPHYKLDKPAMKALIAYLRQLSIQPSPGVTDDTIHFATVIAPGVEPERRQAMLDIIQAIFRQKNGSTVVGTKRGGRRHMVTAAEMILGTERKWQLHEWELQGAPDTWGAQLQRYQSKQPVFALVSGISNGTWKPVHEFCKKERVPCWFPSIASPPSEQDFYSVYFSRGVTLEASVFGQYLRDLGDKKPRRVIQIYRDDDAGRVAVGALRKALADSGVAMEDRILNAVNSGSYDRILEGLSSSDVLMFWLRRADLVDIAKLPPPSVAGSFFSAVLASGEQAPLPNNWKSVAHLVYPYELPDKRLLYVRLFHSWMNMHKLAIVDEPLQAEVFFSMRFLTDTLSEMLDNLYRDYLLDRAENMLSKNEGVKAEQQTKDVASLGRAEELARRYPHAKPLAETVHLPPGLNADSAGPLQSTTIYPRMSLGVGQRFASKGAYIVHFGESGKLVADSEWIIP